MDLHPSPAADRPDPHAAALDELLQLGMLAARAVTAAIVGAEIPDPAQVAALERAGRIVRRTVILARNLADWPASSRRSRRKEARARIIRDMEDAIQRQAASSERPETARAELAADFAAELAERLDDPDLDEELDARPVQDIIQDMRRDFGFEHGPGAHPWARRRPADIRHLRQRAAAPPGPLRTAAPSQTASQAPSPEPAFPRSDFPLP